MPTGNRDESFSGRRHRFIVTALLPIPPILRSHYFVGFSNAGTAVQLYTAGLYTQETWTPYRKTSKLDSYGGLEFRDPQTKMKKGLSVWAASLITVAVYGQSQVDFNNRVNPDVVAPITLCNGRGPGSVPGFTAQLLLVNSDGSTTPLVPTTTFRSSPVQGQFFLNDPGVGVNIPGYFAGETAVLRLIVFNGANFASSTMQGQSPDFVNVLGGDGIVPPSTLSGLQPFTVGDCVPEPSTVALAVLGFGFLIVHFRARGKPQSFRHVGSRGIFPQEPADIRQAERRNRSGFNGGVSAQLLMVNQGDSMRRAIPIQCCEPMRWPALTVLCGR